MAIYHFSGTVISRSQGRSAVAAAAYRSAERLHDERCDRMHDYTKKEDVAFKEILLPEGAPEWMQDRAALWNAVEQREKRKDAQLARDFNIALPRELTLEQNIELIRDFVKTEFVNQGMVADVCLHVDKAKDGELQPHAHVLLTMREVTADGFCQKVRAWNAKENLLQWREHWAETANRHLVLHGHDLRIDHRTLSEQGIDLEPQYKIGAAVAQERLARLEDHQRIARENGERLLAEPEIALTALTRQQSTFTHQDIARFVNRHTVDAEQFAAVYEKVKASPELKPLGQDANERERFTTQTQHALEQSMMANANKLYERQQTHQVANKHQHALIDKPLSDQQKDVLAYVLEKGDLKCVIGYAGTGKSYLLGAAREAWEKQGYHVKGATLSGIAADSLQGGSGIETRTIASRTYYWDKGEQLLTAKDILVIDEAGMLGSRDMARLLEEAQTHGAKVVLVGDPQQLQAIEAGAAFRAIAERTNYIELTEIRRQRETWQQEATREFATAHVATALQRYEQHDHVHLSQTQAEAKKALVDLWNDARLNQPEKTQIMLASTRKDVRELNDIARDLRQQQGELGLDQSVQTAQGERLFAANDRVYFLKNDRDLGVINGSLGTVEAIKGTQLTIRLDRNDLAYNPTSDRITFDTARYNALDLGYAATIHKAQGVTVDRTYVLASRYMDNHSAYVGMSRHRESADLFYSREEFAQRRDLTATLSRDRSKDITLDYTQAPEQMLKSPQRLHEPSTLDVDSLRQRYADRQRQDLTAFKQQFEKQRPELAKQLKEDITPTYERRALEAIKHFNELEKKLEHSSRPRYDREQLEKFAAKLSKERNVMDFIKQQQPAILNKVAELAKSYELDQDRGISR